MSRLAACYFCGTALDDPVQEYPIVPESLRTDDADPTTVALCASCHEKLDAIVGELGDALQTNPTADSPPVESPDDADELLVDPETESRDDPTSTEPNQTVNAVPDPRQTEEREDNSGAEAEPDAEPEPGDPEPDADPDPATASEASGDPDSSDDSTPGGESDTETSSGERSVVEGKHDISALEYNKVMRLLQNREFPVDREEIEVVAANAYQVARSDCATVIDVAVDRGLIAEEDGQLLKPEDA